MYTREQFAKMIDHTLLRPTATRDEVLRVCDEAVERHFASVCLFPSWVGTACRAIQGSDVKVCTVVSFPFGADTRAAKSFAVRNAIANGAREVDVVMNITKFKSGDYDAVICDLSELAEAVNVTGHIGESHGILLKIIIETGLLTDNEKEIASRMVRDSGADFIKTSTGIGTTGANQEDIRLIRRAIGPGVLGIKASGGIKTLEQALLLLNAGANRIGTSCGASLYDQYNPDDYERD